MCTLLLVPSLLRAKKFHEQLEATEAVLATEALVELTTKLVSVWASPLFVDFQCVLFKPAKYDNVYPNTYSVFRIKYKTTSIDL